MGAAAAHFADELNVFPYLLCPPHLSRLDHRVAGEGVFLGDAPRIDANKPFAAVVLLTGPFFLFWGPLLMGNWHRRAVLRLRDTVERRGAVAAEGDWGRRSIGPFLTHHLPRVFVLEFAERRVAGGSDAFVESEAAPTVDVRDWRRGAPLPNSGVYCLTVVAVVLIVPIAKHVEEAAARVRTTFATLKPMLLLMFVAVVIVVAAAVMMMLLLIIIMPLHRKVRTVVVSMAWLDRRFDNVRRGRRGHIGVPAVGRTAPRHCCRGG